MIMWLFPQEDLTLMSVHPTAELKIPKKKIKTKGLKMVFFSLTPSASCPPCPSALAALLLLKHPGLPLPPPTLALNVLSAKNTPPSHRTTTLSSHSTGCLNGAFSAKLSCLVHPIHNYNSCHSLSHPPGLLNSVVVMDV